MDKIKLCTLKSVYFTFFHVRIFRKQATSKGARIAQSVEHQTFNLRVQGSSPCSGAFLGFWYPALTPPPRVFPQRKNVSDSQANAELNIWDLYIRTVAANV